MLFVRNISRSYGAVNVLESISFVINPGERVGLVGANGVGKSTLLRILTGEETADAGTFAFAPSAEVGYLPQTTPDFYGSTIDDLIRASVGGLRQLEERMKALEAAMAVPNAENLEELIEEYGRVSTRFQDQDGYQLDYRIETVLSGLGLAYLPRDREVATLSGGERERLGLATLLLRSPDLLLLDEPTNHLDFASMEWLESYLAQQRGTLLIVSHDRQFLNRTVTQIFEIDEHTHRLKTYTGNYDAYLETRAAERVKWEEDYAAQQEELKELRKAIRETARQVGHNNRAPRDNDKFAVHFFAQRQQSTVARRVRSAQEQLKRIEADPIPRPPSLTEVNTFFGEASLQSQIVIQGRQLVKGFEPNREPLLRGLDLTLTHNSRVLLVGPNGAGKTTLLRLLLGRETPDAGEIQTVAGARIGYLAQDPELAPERTVLETYRYGQVGYEEEFTGRLIGYGLFRLEDLPKQTRQLSLGQQRKLELARLMATRPNVLLLDEPTNYLSLDVLEAFEAAILAFPGPVLAISHDRWFIQRFRGEVWQLKAGCLERQS